MVEQSRDLLAMEKAGTFQVLTMYSWADWLRSRVSVPMDSPPAPWNTGPLGSRSAS